MEKLDKWETAFLWDGIASQIEMVSRQIANLKEPNHLTDSECEVIKGLIQKIRISFEFVEEPHWDWLLERVGGVPKYHIQTPKS